MDLSIVRVMLLSRLVADDDPSENSDSDGVDNSPAVSGLGICCSSSSTSGPGAGIVAGSTALQATKLSSAARSSGILFLEYLCATSPRISYETAL